MQFTAETDALNCGNPVDCCDDDGCSRDVDSVGQSDWRTGKWCRRLHDDSCDVAEQPTIPVEDLGIYENQLC